MKIILAIASLLLPFALYISCADKPMYKSFTDISPGDTKKSVLQYWGKPHRIKKDTGEWGTRELWIYECLASADCGDSECRFDAPCYILLFENNRLVNIHNST